MTLQSTPTLAGYDEAHSSAAAYRVPDPGYLRIAGADRADFIQRQTTNDIRSLTPDRALLTVLTSGTAKILDVWRALNAPDAEAIDVITLPGRGRSTAQYLQGRIFFMDKVEVTDRSAEYAQIVIMGPHSARVLAALGIERVPEPHAVVRVAFDGADVTVIGPGGMIGRGVTLLTRSDHAEALLERLADAGAALLTPDAVEVLRVEIGLPGPARELTADFTPLEVAFDAAISATKGCYAGQEVIARQVTYDKVARRLVRLRLDAPVAVDARVAVEGRGAGTITSAVESPRMGPLALAVLRRAHSEPGTVVSVIGEDGDMVAGAVIAAG